MFYVIFYCFSKVVIWLWEDESVLLGIWNVSFCFVEFWKNIFYKYGCLEDINRIKGFRGKYLRRSYFFGLFYFGFLIKFWGILRLEKKGVIIVFCNFLGLFF